MTTDSNLGRRARRVAILTVAALACALAAPVFASEEESVLPVGHTLAIELVPEAGPTNAYTLSLAVYPVTETGNIYGDAAEFEARRVQPYQTQDGAWDFHMTPLTRIRAKAGIVDERTAMLRLEIGLGEPVGSPRAGTIPESTRLDYETTAEIPLGERHRIGALIDGRGRRVDVYTTLRRDD